MAVKKKTTAKKKTTTKKAAAKKSAPAAPKVKAIPEKQTKTQIVSQIAEETGLSKKDVNAVFQSLGQIVEGHMKKRGSGEITIPETGVKVRRQRKPATKSRKGVNPFTGEPMTIKAKPARNTVKVTALKALKETVNK